MFPGKHKQPVHYSIRAALAIYILTLDDHGSLQAAADSGATAPKSSAPGMKKEEGKIEGAVKIAIGVKKEVDFPTWYTNVLIKANMSEYYDVSGCYILRPWSFSIWETIQGACQL